jgi:hypothetical protein
MWFLHRKIILTKDKLTKQNWLSNTKCCFCNQEETIQHLFIECPLAKIVWRIFYTTFNISLPTSIANLFGYWLLGVNKPFGTRGAMLFLTYHNLLHSFRLFGWPLTDPYVILSSSWKRNGRT